MLLPKPETLGITPSPLLKSLSITSVSWQFYWLANPLFLKVTIESPPVNAAELEAPSAEHW